ncbi:hypothetical protein G6F31_021819 [Rhizopus arrhizus]|nr:hypothetical protein G6F31_021819 [Rhizopus arrhizus]
MPTTPCWTARWPANPAWASAPRCRGCRRRPGTSPPTTRIRVSTRACPTTTRAPTSNRSATTCTRSGAMPTARWMCRSATASPTASSSA